MEYWNLPVMSNLIMAKQHSCLLSTQARYFQVHKSHSGLKNYQHDYFGVDTVPVQITEHILNITTPDEYYTWTYVHQGFPQTTVHDIEFKSYK